MNRNILVIKPKTIVYWILFLTILFNPLIAELGFPSTIIYINDVLCLVLLYFLIKRRGLYTISRYGLNSTTFILIVFAITLGLSAFVNFVDPFLVIWAIRNTLRFYVFYVACIYYLSINDVEKIFDYLFWVQILNFIFALYQYFVLGLYMDRLGGIFGHGNGQALNTFQALIYAYYLAGYFSKKKPLYKVVIIGGTALIIAALAEEKAFFVYFAICTIIVVIFSRVSFKTCLIVIICALFLPVVLDLLVSLNGEDSLAILQNTDALLAYAESSYGLSRSNPFPQISKLFFDNNILHYLFGLGFGFCENSNIAIFNSPFYEKYAYLQYFDFTHQKRFLETGYLGFGTFLLLFFDNIRLMLKQIRLTKRNDFQATAILAFNVIVIMSCWFSGALIFKDAYIIYFGAAITGMIIKDRKKG